MSPKKQSQGSDAEKQAAQGPDTGGAGEEAQGPQRGSGTGSGTPASESKEGRTFTRGDDPQAAEEELLKANRGSTGGEYNATPPRTTPQGDGEGESKEEKKRDQ